MRTAALGLVCTSCALTQVAPGVPSLGGGAPAGLLERTVLWIEPIDVDFESDLGGEHELALTDALRAYFREDGGWAAVVATRGQVSLARREHPELRVLHLRPRLRADYTTRRTFILDVMMLATAGYFPLAPSWGEVEVALSIEVRELDGREATAPLVSEVATSHGTFVWGPVRTDELERAFRRAYGRAFGDVAAALRARVEGGERRAREAVLLAGWAGTSTATDAVAGSTRAVAAQEGAQPADAGAWGAPRVLAMVPHPYTRANGASASASVAMASASASVAMASDSVVAGALAVPLPIATATAAAPSIELASAARTVPWAAPSAPPPPLWVAGQPDGPIFLEPEDFDILTRPYAIDPTDDGLAWRYLRALGGLEAAAFRGSATVESRTFTANAPDELVGSGEAVASGYRFSFYRPPDRTGFFFPPSIGLLWEDIVISGFRQALPVAQSSDIPALASDPATGQPVDPNAPIAYALQLRSGYLGQGLGLNLVAGVEDFQIFLTLQGHLNLIELRYVQAEIGRSRVDGYQVVGAQSLGVGGQLGVVFPSAHLALRGMFSQEWFFEFEYPQPVEFQAAVRYVPEKDVFERERAFVRGASVRTFNAQIALSVLF